MSKKLISALIVLVIAGSLLYGGHYLYLNPNQEGFSLNNIVIKNQLIEGQNLQTSLKITNLLDETQFTITSQNLEEVMVLEENNFILSKYQSKDLIVKFKGTSPGIHSGSLVIKTNLEERIVPIIISVSTKSPLFFTLIDEDSASKDIAPGSKSNINVKLYNILDDASHAVKITYLIKDLNGNVISEETEDNVVGGSETSFTKTISIPEGFEKGNYVYGIITQYGNSISTSSYLFNIGGKTLLPSKNSELNSILLLFIIFIFSFLLIVILVFIFMVHERDRLFIELRRQHDNEVKFYGAAIDKKSLSSIAKAKTSKEKKKIVVKYKEMKRKAFKILKQKYEKQVKHLKFLKKAKKTNEMKKKISEWKKQGYNVSELTSLSGTEKKDMNSFIKEWKKQGYNVDVLKK